MLSCYVNTLSNLKIKYSTQICCILILNLNMYLYSSAEQLTEAKLEINAIFLASNCLVGQKMIRKPVFVQ